MSGRRIDTSHITTPHDPMTAQEREAVWAEMRESHEALALVVARDGNAIDGWNEIFKEALGKPSNVDAA